MADKLTPQQEIAVTNRGGKLLVSAAAGSGKTKVLVDRLLSYLTDSTDPANLDEFLIITYTKAAASELRGKIAEKLTQRIALEPENMHLQKQMQRLYLAKISTVHGFCSDILREYAYKLDIPADFRVADENECLQIRQEVLEQLLDDAYEKADGDADFRAFVDSQGLGRDDRLVPEIVQKVFDSARCHLDPEGWLDGCLSFADTEGIRDAGGTVWGKYLMEDLFSYLDMQLPVMEACARQVGENPEMAKTAGNLMETLHQLESLRGCQTWDEVVQRRNLDYGRLVFPRKNVDLELAERVKAVRNACKKGLERKLRSFSDPSAKVLEDLAQSAGGTRGLVALVREFSRRYLAAKRGRRILDFGDLEHRTLDLLLGKNRGGITAAAVEIGERFREIMVDEYQDSNGVQAAIFDALSRTTQNCFLVGGVKQSIYQFRLADPGIFLKTYREYPPADSAGPGEGRKVLLSHNFRSGVEVIDGVNAVFKACMSPKVGGLRYTQEEALREGVPRTPLGGPGVELYALEIREDTYAEDAAFTAEKIQTMPEEKTLIGGKDGLGPGRPEDIVILLRSPGSVGNRFQRALEERGIPCCTGGGTDLLRTEEVGTLRSVLRTVMNPRQDIPLVSTLASPVFGFTADDLAALRSVDKRGTVYDALTQWDNPKAEDFLAVLNTLRADAGRMPLSQLLERCLLLTRMDSVYAAMPGGTARLSNLRSFFRLASEFEMGNSRDLGQFLEYLDSREEKGLITESADTGGVTIMSIHKSKGLEFPVVFLGGLGREFNTESLRAQILCDQQLGLGLSVADSTNRIRYPSIAKRAISVKMAAQGLSEELRVLYVAMTRAKDRLVMTYASRNLEAELKNIALRKDYDHGALLGADARCPGDWVMLTAMGRTEAAQLFGLAGCITSTSGSEYPWKIEVTQAPGEVSGTVLPGEQSDLIPEGSMERLKSALSFHYAHIAATQAPSKQTATGRKGRAKDEEAAEDTRQQARSWKQWRKPSFFSGEAGGKTYGNAIHKAMQYLPFERCADEDSIREEVQKLVERRLLTAEEGGMVNCGKIAAFFQTGLGQKLLGGVSCIREFKFSILDSAEHYGDSLEGEWVLLQGVVDCALLEEDGITVIDFKTDAVTEDTLAAAAQRYRGQIMTYCDALSRIYEMPVKERYLYFFRLNRFVAI